MKPTTFRNTWIVPLFTAALALGGCEDSDDDGESGSSTTMDPMTSTGTSGTSTSGMTTSGGTGTGTGTSGDAGTGTGTTGMGTTTDATAGDTGVSPECATCVETNCAAQIQACFADTVCACFQPCAAMAGADVTALSQCYQTCGADPTLTEGVVFDIVSCSATSCAAQCV